MSACEWGKFFYFKRFTTWMTAGKGGGYGFHLVTFFDAVTLFERGLGWDSLIPGF